MDPQRIKTFIDAMAESDLDEMEISHEGWTLRLVRRQGGRHETIATPSAGAAPVRPAQPARAPAAKAAARPEVLSPMFGVVHLQQSPGEPPFVREGQAIAPGDLLCVIEAMKVFNEVRAERAGTLAAILVKSGQEVEADQALLRLE